MNELLTKLLDSPTWMDREFPDGYVSHNFIVLRGCGHLEEVTIKSKVNMSEGVRMEYEELLIRYKESVTTLCTNCIQRRPLYREGRF